MVPDTQQHVWQQAKHKTGQDSTCLPRGRPECCLRRDALTRVQERIKSLIELRKRLVDDGWAGEPARPGSLSANPGGRKPGKGQSDGNSSMVEKERQRLEVLKKRQERDLQQMLQYEQQRKELLDKQQAKVRCVGH